MGIFRRDKKIIVIAFLLATKIMKRGVRNKANMHLFGSHEKAAGLPSGNRQRRAGRSAALFRKKLCRTIGHFCCMNLANLQRGQRCVTQVVLQFGNLAFLMRF